MTTAPTTPLTGRRVVIVGGGSGTGLEVARLAIANGAHVTRAGSGGSGPAGSGTGGAAGVRRLVNRPQLLLAVA
ncbi:hypothetical protein [Streptomyces sp. NPDC001404]|uniref:hypothetical protein n=1 Tax=Streptomyces sp. NPDC001404 TaxID=3364571 RepID=UPI0036CD7753